MPKKILEFPDKRIAVDAERHRACQMIGYLRDPSMRSKVAEAFKMTADDMAKAIGLDPTDLDDENASDCLRTPGSIGTNHDEYFTKLNDLRIKIGKPGQDKITDFLNRFRPEKTCS